MTETNNSNTNSGNQVQQKPEKIVLSPELSLLVFIRVPEIFNVVSPYFDDLYVKNRYEKAFINAYRELNNPEASEPLLKNLMLQTLSYDEVNAVLEVWRSIDPDKLSRADIQVVLAKLEYYVKGLLFQNVVAQAIDNSGINDQLIEKCTDISNVAFDKSNLMDFSDDSLVDNLFETEVQTSLIQSSIPSINNAFIYGGYKTTQLVMVCAAPGVGKSTFMITEGAAALKQNKRVLHFFLGDLTPFDVLCKYIACLLNVDMVGVIANPKKFYSDDLKNYFSRLRVACYASGDITSAKLVSLCKNIHHEFPFDMVIIDYDSNVKAVHDSMYEEGGQAYSDYDKIAKNLNALVMIGSQPKIQYWSEEVLPKESASESSRKQHTTDVLLTIGRNSNNNNVGTILIAKSRRRGEGVKISIKFDYGVSQITEISEVDYLDAIKVAQLG